MKFIKQKSFVWLLLAAFITSCSLSIVTPQTSMAYRCPEGQKFEDDGDGDFVCYELVPDKNKGKPTGITDSTGTVINPKCGDGQVLHSDGYCWTYKRVNTDDVPVNDDGTAVNPGNFGCEAGFTYDAGANRCRKCNGQSRYTPDGCSEWEEKNPIQIKEDPTTANVKKCEDQGGVIKAGRGCVWETPQACEKRSSQSVWVKDEDTGDGSCRLFSDFPSQQACQKVGGEFKVVNAHDANNPADDEWACVKPGTNGENTLNNGNNGATGITQRAGSGSCGPAQTNLISCDGEGIGALGHILKQALGILTIIVGIAAVGGIAYAAVLYASATDNASQTQQAIGLIRNIVIGIVVYGFMIAIINWLVPGNIIG